MAHHTLNPFTSFWINDSAILSPAPFPRVCPCWSSFVIALSSSEPISCPRKPSSPPLWPTPISPDDLAPLTLLIPLTLHSIIKAYSILTQKKQKIIWSSCLSCLRKFSLLQTQRNFPVLLSLQTYVLPIHWGNQTNCAQEQREEGTYEGSKWEDIEVRPGEPPSPDCSPRVEGCREHHGWQDFGKVLGHPKDSWVPYLSQMQLSLQAEETLQAGTREDLKGNQCGLMPEWDHWGALILQKTDALCGSNDGWGFITYIQEWK